MLKITKIWILVNIDSSENLSYYYSTQSRHIRTVYFMPLYMFSLPSYWPDIDPSFIFYISFSHFIDTSKHSQTDSWPQSICTWGIILIYINNIEKFTLPPLPLCPLIHTLAPLNVFSGLKTKPLYCHQNFNLNQQWQFPPHGVAIIFIQADLTH